MQGIEVPKLKDKHNKYHLLNYYNLVFLMQTNKYPKK